MVKNYQKKPQCAQSFSEVGVALKSLFFTNLFWNFTATMEIFDVEANNFEFYFKKIGSIVLTLTDV